MLELHKRMIANYYRNLKENYSEDVIKHGIMNPSQKVIEAFNDDLENELRAQATLLSQAEINEIRSLDADDAETEQEVKYIIEKDVTELLIGILKCALIYNIAFPSEYGNELVQYIDSTSITEVLNRYNYEGSFKNEINLNYIKYLVSKAEALITSYQESVIISQTKTIWNLSYNKGMTSIAELAKLSFLELYEDLLDVYDSTQIFWEKLDLFIKEDIYLNYFEQNGIDTSDKKYLKLIKTILIRSILSDAYISLKSIEAELEDVEDDFLTVDEYKAIEHIENAIKSKSYVLPKDKNVRHNIYCQAVSYNSEILPYREEYFNDLDDDVKKHALTLNPFSQM